MKTALIFFITCISLLQIACDKDTPQPHQYRYAETLSIDGLQRTYTVQLPEDYFRDSADKPLVIALHGTGGSGSQFENDYAFGSRANKEGFIAVYPEGVQKQDGRLKIRTWNAGSCCDYAMKNNVNDVKFISTVIDELSAKFNVNLKKVYIAGMSNGAMMAYRFAAEQPSKIAAIATVSGSMVYEKNLSLQGVIPLLHIHSLLDTKVPFNGGRGIQDYHFPPVIEGIHYWVKRNACDSAAFVQNYSGYEVHSWKNTTGDTLVQCYLTHDGGHSWPGADVQRRIGDEPSKVIDANDLIWRFFNRFALP